MLEQFVPGARCSVLSRVSSSLLTPCNPTLPTLFTTVPILRGFTQQNLSEIPVKKPRYRSCICRARFAGNKRLHGARVASQLRGQPSDDKHRQHHGLAAHSDRGTSPDTGAAPITARDRAQFCGARQAGKAITHLVDAASSAAPSPTVFPGPTLASNKDESGILQPPDWKDSGLKKCANKKTGVGCASCLVVAYSQLYSGFRSSHLPACYI